MRKFLPLVLALVLLATFSLVPSAVSALPAVVPSVTVTVTNLTCASATLSVTIPAVAGGCQCFDVYFEYGTSSGVYTDRTEIKQTCQLGTYSADIKLKPCTRYYARAARMCVYTPFSDPCPINQVLLGVGLDPVGLPSLLNQYANPTIVTSPEVTFNSMMCCSSSSTTNGSSGGGVTMGSTIRPFLPPMFEVQNATVAGAKAGPGEQVEVTATVTNKGGSNGTTKVVLYVNGQEADSKGVALASGQSTPVSFKVSRNEPGTYQIYVNGTSAGSFTVDLFNSNDMLIYGSVGLFAIGMIGLLYYLYRRRTPAQP